MGQSVRFWSQRAKSCRTAIAEPERKTPGGPGGINRSHGALVRPPEALRLSSLAIDEEENDQVDDGHSEDNEKRSGGGNIASKLGREVFHVRQSY